jgi:hypothetical protein
MDDGTTQLSIFMKAQIFTKMIFLCKITVLRAVFITLQRKFGTLDKQNAFRNIK